MDIVTLALAVGKAKAYTDTAVQAIAGGLRYKGSVATVADLPTPSASNKGWMYTVLTNNHELVCDGTQWLDLFQDLEIPVQF